VIHSYSVVLIVPVNVGRGAYKLVDKREGEGEGERERKEKYYRNIGNSHMCSVKGSRTYTQKLSVPVYILELR
jgi:hypothetical protein